MIRFLPMPLLVIATLLTVPACNGKSSSNATEQSSVTAGSAAPSPTATTPDSVYGDPVFPGAVVQPTSVNNMSGTESTVLAVDDSFDEVYAWYQERMPENSEISHTEAPMQGAVFITGSGKNQVRVTLAPSDPKDTLVTYMRLKP